MRTPAVLPGAAVGVLGSGQLGRMFAIAARQMGYRVLTFSPESGTPTGQAADTEVTASYDDLDAVRAFAKQVAVVTFEFENVPAVTAAAAAEWAPVRPGGEALHIAQNRLREKTFLERAGIPHAPFRCVDSLESLANALAALGTPVILKTAGFGYDGKGQRRIDTPEQAPAAWSQLSGQECVLESFVAFDRELSVVAARGLDGAFRHYGVIENSHTHHVLDISKAPADVSTGLCNDAVEIARLVMEKLAVTGVLCVEFFLTADNRLLVNEIAPRPHNSGHLTIDACVTGQFEQQLRAVCGLPLGSTQFHAPGAAMANLLGDLWEGGEPNWPAALADPSIRLHLYGKLEPRAGRKMGHLTALARTPEEAAAKVSAARDALK